MPLPMPSTLNDVFSMNPAAFNQAQEMIGLGMQQGQADLKKTQLANLFDEQNNPGRVRHQQLQNDSLEAQLPGMAANSRSLGLKADREAATQDEAIEAAKKKFIADATEDDIKQLENHARGMAMSRDPSVRAKGELLLGQTKSMIEERLKQEAQQKRQLELEGVRGKNQRDLMQMQIDAGRFNKVAKGSQDALEKALVSGSWDKAATAYDAMAQRALEGGDREQALYYAQKAKEYSDKYILARNQVKPGQVDTPAFTNLPATPQPTTSTPALPGVDLGPSQVPPKPQQMTLQQVQQLYPGIPPEKLKEAFKKKFNVDLK